MTLVLLSLLFYCVVCLITTSLGLFLSFLLYLYYIHKIHEHLPGPPRSSFIFGHLPDITEYRNKGGTLLDYRREVQSKYGPITVIFVGYIALVDISDRVYIAEILNEFNRGYKPTFLYKKLGHVFGHRAFGTSILTNLDDDSWRRRRQIMAPAFHRKCLKNFMKDYNEVADRFTLRMANIVGQDTNMVREFANLTTDVISSISFNVRLGAIEDRNCRLVSAIDSVLRGAETSFRIPLPSSFLSIFQFSLFQSASIKEYIDSVKFLRKFAHDCVTKRMDDIKADRDVPDDLLTMLVNDKSLSMDDIVDEFLVVFIAGQETTASSLGFTLYEITQNPDIEAKILNELNDVVGNKQDIDFGDLSKLKYLGQVLQESLRKYPVAFGPVRYLRNEITVGGFKIRKASFVVLEKYLIGHNPSVWANPEIFNPDRFSEPEKIPNFSATYFPFSLGPRNCIGQTFSKFESKVVLAKLLRKFQFELLPGQTGEMEERMSGTPRGGVVCKVLRRC